MKKEIIAKVTKVDGAYRANDIETGKDVTSMIDNQPKLEYAYKKSGLVKGVASDNDNFTWRVTSSKIKSDAAKQTNINQKKEFTSSGPAKLTNNQQESEEEVVVQGRSEDGFVCIAFLSLGMITIDGEFDEREQKILEQFVEGKIITRQNYNAATVWFKHTANAIKEDRDVLFREFAYALSVVNNFDKDSKIILLDMLKLLMVADGKIAEEELSYYFYCGAEIGFTIDQLKENLEPKPSKKSVSELLKQSKKNVSQKTVNQVKKQQRPAAASQSNPAKNSGCLVVLGIILSVSAFLTYIV